jgi:Domain of unknown function (DUF4259)
MGAWGIQGLDNDRAMDFVGDFLDAPSEKLLDEAVRRIADAASDRCLEVPDCERAIAAAEIVAALLGSPIADLPERLASWLKDSATFRADRALVAMAIESVRRIGAQSELQELWADVDESEAWQQEMADLERRLNSAIPVGD